MSYEREELERLELRATKDWELSQTQGGNWTVFKQGRRYQTMFYKSGIDAALCVALRNAAPELFADLRRLQAEVKLWKYRVEEAYDVVEKFKALIEKFRARNEELEACLSIIYHGEFLPPQIQAAVRRTLADEAAHDES